MAESYVAHNIGRFHQLVQRLGNEILSNVICKTGDCWQASGKNVIGIYSDSARSMDDRENFIKKKKKNTIIHLSLLEIQDPKET